jgi:hypothetical protein
LQFAAVEGRAMVPLPGDEQSCWKAATRSWSLGSSSLIPPTLPNAA